MATNLPSCWGPGAGLRAWQASCTWAQHSLQPRDELVEQKGCVVPCQGHILHHCASPEPWAKGTLGSPLSHVPFVTFFSLFMVEFSFFSSSSVLCLSWKEKHGDYSSLIIHYSSRIFVQLCTECFWTPAAKNCTAVFPWIFFSVYLTFSIHFMVTAAGHIETPHPLFWNLGFTEKVFRKALPNVWLSHTDWGTDAAGEACETWVPACANAPILGALVSLACRGMLPWVLWAHSCPSTPWQTQGFELLLMSILCIRAYASPLAAPNGLVWVLAMPDRVAETVPSAGRAFALPLQPFVLLRKPLPSEIAPLALPPTMVYL